MTRTAYVPTHRVTVTLDKSRVSLHKPQHRAPTVFERMVAAEQSMERLRAEHEAALAEFEAAHGRLYQPGRDEAALVGVSA